MQYSEKLIGIMREDLTQHGVAETRTPADVDAALAGEGTVLMVVNSVCGCAAGKARPAVGMALQFSAVKPSKAVTVFAGGDVEATAHLREAHLADFPPSSPSMALFKDGKPVFYLHRREIETRQAPEIAQVLQGAFQKFC